MFSYFFQDTTDWNTIKEQLDIALQKQDYQTIIQTLYKTRTAESFAWLQEHEEENHIPLLYIMVRDRYLDGFNNNDKEPITQALYWAFKSIVIAMMHIAECREINKKFAILDILTQKYEEKFASYIDLQIFEEALECAETYFENLLEREFNSLLKDDPPCNILPNPVWIYTVQMGGHWQPALNCIPPMCPELIKGKFNVNCVNNFESHRHAFEQAKENFRMIYEQY